MTRIPIGRVLLLVGTWGILLGGPGQASAEGWSLGGLVAPVPPGQSMQVFEPTESRGMLEQPTYVDDAASSHPTDWYHDVHSPPQPGNLTSHKDGFFQKLSITSTWLNGGGAQAVGMTDVEMYGIFALPAPTKEMPLLLIPGFNNRFWDGRPEWQLPSKLYEAYMHFTWLPMFTEQWGAVLSLGPGMYADYHSSQDGFRLLGKGIAIYKLVPDVLEFYAGVLYLDRDDYPILPTGGVIWGPTPDWRLELLFPRPKVARRLSFVPGQFENWVYVSGEFGGEQWAVERQGIGEKLTMRDLRLITGWERKQNGGSSFRVEAAYVFNRKFEFNTGELYKADDTFMLRAAYAY